jgi:AraC family transcriptional regulator
VCVPILRRFADVSFREDRSTAGLSPLQTKMVAGYIEANLERQLSLEELAQIAHVSASHFLRQFKRRFGCAPHCYVIQRRLACAQRLLSKTRLPIKEIALKCGFSDQSHMTRMFQRYLNATPQGYRATFQS